MPLALAVAADCKDADYSCEAYDDVGLFCFPIQKAGGSSISLGLGFLTAEIDGPLVEPRLNGLLSSDAIKLINGVYLYELASLVSSSLS